LQKLRIDVLKFISAFLCLLFSKERIQASRFALSGDDSNDNPRNKEREDVQCTIPTGKVELPGRRKIRIIESDGCE
jgi:hypothetical protein